MRNKSISFSFFSKNRQLYIMNYPVPASKNELTYMHFLYVKCISRILLYMLIDLNCKQIRKFPKKKRGFLNAGCNTFAHPLPI